MPGISHRERVTYDIEKYGDIDMISYEQSEEDQETATRSTERPQDSWAGIYDWVKQ